MPVVEWSPDDWQQYCQELFAGRHGASYQSVPDRVRGDWGIEGYTSDGIAYQCYAPEEPLSTKALYEQLRDKLTADIGKLCANAAHLVPLIHPSCVTCWILVTPRIEDKEILVHAAKKAFEVVERGLNGFAGDFYIRVHTLQDFVPERRHLGEMLTLQAPLVDAGPDEDVDRFAETSELDVEQLDSKLRALLAGHPESDVRVLRGQFLRHYIEGDQLDGWFRRAHPPLWERWDQARRRTTGTLRTDALTTPDGPKPRLERITRELEVAAGRTLEGVQVGVAKQLALGTIAGWLLDCPLDFRSGVDASEPQ